MMNVTHHGMTGIVLVATLGIVHCGALAPSAPTAEYLSALGTPREAEARAKEGTYWKDGHVPDFYRSAEAYCANLQKQSMKASTRYSELGWTFGIIGLMGSGAGFGAATTSGPNGFADGSWKALMGAAGGLGLALGAFSVYWLARSQAADKITSEAITAGNTGDVAQKNWAACLKVRSHWAEENASATDQGEDELKKAQATVAPGSSASATPSPNAAPTSPAPAPSATVAPQ